MLSSETKRKIDNARNILVGKIPTPTGQVEHITLALMYKFMNDMDTLSNDLGGKAKFFTGAYRQYAWKNIMDPGTSAHERVKLYSQGLEKMSTNPALPLLFREIFKRAFLPFRDPEVLSLFLKQIDEFSYDHSEELGNAFEYLLSIMGTQGEAGQLRTPRHIIDFIVKVVDPKKTDRILDPACGTAGFLISAFKHIMAENTKKGSDKPGSNLTQAEKNRLPKNIVGYDISYDMVRLSLVNLYLHEFPDPKIYEYDTLTSEERWDDDFDCILANPPFMSPTGGIRPHRRFQIQANRSEVLFVDYIAEHLTTNGKAGVIVPEGIIFQSSNAYKALRKMLVENHLWAVVSLPAGVFNPYAGVKTCILLMDKVLAKKTTDILFVKIENDGFDLGAQRKPIDKNDLDLALKILGRYKKTLALVEDDKKLAIVVAKSKVAKSGGYDLIGDRYKENGITSHCKWPLVELGNEKYFQIESGGTPSSGNPEYWNGDINWVTLVDLPASNFITEIYDTKRKITAKGLKSSSAKLLPINSILISSRATIGRIGTNRVVLATNQGYKNIIIKNFDQVNSMFVAFMVTRLVDQMQVMASGGTFKEISKTNIAKLKIPLPPLEVQSKIVAELDGYQKIMDGARQVIANYKPQIKLDPRWDIVELGELCDLVGGGTPSKENSAYWTNGTIKWVSSKHFNGDYLVDSDSRITEQAVTESSTTVVPENTIILITRVSLGKMAITRGRFAINQDLTGLLIKDSSRLNVVFLFYLLKGMTQQIIDAGQGIGVKGVTRDFVKKMKIPLPNIESQKQIVVAIEEEQKLVEANKKIVVLFERKNRDKMDEVWGRKSEAEKQRTVSTFSD